MNMKAIVLTVRKWDDNWIIPASHGRQPRPVKAQAGWSLFAELV